MYLSLIFLSAVLSTCMGVDIDMRILAGSDAAYGEFPFQVSLQYEFIGNHYCSGAILNDKYVITAAHCLAGFSRYRILVTSGPYYQYPEKVFSVHKTIIHENYNLSDSVRNDIGLIKVSTPFVFSDKISPVVLPKRNIQLSSNQGAVISGWGTTIYPGINNPRWLQKIDVTIIDNEICKKMYQNVSLIVRPTQICTYQSSTIARGPCKGDSGGPLIMDGNLLIGIYSWSRKEPSCGSPKYPNVYTRVTEYLEWIVKHVDKPAIAHPSASRKPVDDYKIYFRD